MLPTIKDPVPQCRDPIFPYNFPPLEDEVVVLGSPGLRVEKVQASSPDLSTGDILSFPAWLKSILEFSPSVTDSQNS